MLDTDSDDEDGAELASDNPEVALDEADDAEPVILDSGAAADVSTPSVELAGEGSGEDVTEMRDRLGEEEEVEVMEVRGRRRSSDGGEEVVVVEEKGRRERGGGRASDRHVVDLEGYGSSQIQEIQDTQEEIQEEGNGGTEEVEDEGEDEEEEEEEEEGEELQAADVDEEEDDVDDDADDDAAQEIGEDGGAGSGGAGSAKGREEGTGKAGDGARGEAGEQDEEGEQEGEGEEAQGEERSGGGGNRTVEGTVEKPAKVPSSIPKRFLKELRELREISGIPEPALASDAAEPREGTQARNGAAAGSAPRGWVPPSVLRDPTSIACYVPTSAPHVPKQLPQDVMSLGVRLFAKSPGALLWQQQAKARRGGGGSMRTGNASSITSYSSFFVEHAKTGDAAFSISLATHDEAGENNGVARDSCAKPADPPARRSASKHRRASSVSRPAWLSEEQICAALAAPPVPPAFGAPSPRNAASAAASASRRSSWALAATAHGIMAEGFGWETMKGDLCDSGNSRGAVVAAMPSPSSANSSTSSGNRIKSSFSSGDNVTDKDDVSGADAARLPWLPPVISSRSSSGESYPCLATPRSNRARRRSFTNTSSVRAFRHSHSAPADESPGTGGSGGGNAPPSPMGRIPSSGFGGGGAMTPRQRAARSMFPRAVSASSAHVSGESAGGGIGGANRRRGGGRVVGRVGSSPLQPSPLQAFTLQPSLLQAAASVSGVDAPAQENNPDINYFLQAGSPARAGPGLGRRGVTVAAAPKLKPLPELRQLSGRVALRQFSGLSGAPSYSSYRERRQQQPRQLQRHSTAPCDEIDGSVFEMVDPEESNGSEPAVVDGQCA
ncbi:unnamed protein product [Closterium sp. Yama58-4]|nr:unnamed protein product [Closterium sp. Yama58-4]